MRQKVGNHIYIYEAINHWDKEPRQERKYLGRIEIETNSFVKTKRIRGREAKEI
ncbi:MAG: hypothetical protein ACP5SP_06525 [Caldisericum sp.]|uniref:hypothetical protein n=1 Tax=Caldisericum sp. TaxID=2499687 RepID=UPI003D0EA3B6